MNARPNAIRHRRPLWNLVRALVLGLLLLLAPAIDLVCGGLLLLGLLIAIAFKVSAAGSGFSVWPMVALSLGFGLFAILYHALIGLLSR